MSVHVTINGRMLALWAPSTGHISDACVQAVELAKMYDGHMWMLFNGTPAEVKPDSTPDDVFKSWCDFREAYHRGKGI